MIVLNICSPYAKDEYQSISCVEGLLNCISVWFSLCGTEIAAFFKKINLFHDLSLMLTQQQQYESYYN